MNKTERQLAIILELQRTNVVKAEDLAKKLETSVRTIYRDVQALSEAGVPIIGATGFGYSLVEGYFLPPVNFTVEEAVSFQAKRSLNSPLFPQNKNKKQSTFFFS